jgi:hypothetical protein
MTEVKEYLLIGEKVLEDNQNNRIEYIDNEKGKIEKMILYYKEKYVTVYIKVNRKMINVKIQHPVKLITFEKIIIPDSEEERQIKAMDIFYVDFVKKFVYEKGIPAFIIYATDYFQNWINEIFSYLFL